MLFFMILLHSIVATPQLNLLYTNWINQSTNENDNMLQHNCLRVMGGEGIHLFKRVILTYCMSELPSKFHIDKTDWPRRFTFSELLKRNITSEHLYLWSTPIDIIEDYQFYLNQLKISNKSELANHIFYNCTLPRFGPMCQYELPFYHSTQSSLIDIISYSYSKHPSSMSSLTCYMHVQCNRGPYSSCLDWTEICDGYINCPNDGIDEKYCWQLEINECKDDEYRCRNGQCISQSLGEKRSGFSDCIDASDFLQSRGISFRPCDAQRIPSSVCEDITCKFQSLKHHHIFLTSSCNEQREKLLISIMYSNNKNSNSTFPDFWSTFECFIEFQLPIYTNCNTLCKYHNCTQIVLDTCPNILFFPNTSVLFGNIYFVYKKDDLFNQTSYSTVPFYVCYNSSDYNHFFINITKIFLNNMICVFPESFLSFKTFSTYPVKQLHYNIMYKLYQLLKKYHLPFTYTSTICNRSNMYQCRHSSKCISIYRIMDGVYDCPHVDDENFIENDNKNITAQLKKTYFKCVLSNKYIHQSLLLNKDCDCGKNLDYNICEDEDTAKDYAMKNIIFRNICDRVTDQLPMIINGRNETDETECEYWKCNNIYTHGNSVWNCLNGEDESGYYPHQPLNCSSKHHVCIAPDKNQFVCLPIEKANDGHIDCLGGTDEPDLFTTRNCSTNQRGYEFYCMNQTSPTCVSKFMLCDGYSDCKHGDDEQFCRLNRTFKRNNGICSQNIYTVSDVEQFLCKYIIPIKLYILENFKHPGLIQSFRAEKTNIQSTVLSQSSINTISHQHQPRCHRGLDIRVWLKNSTNMTCLCPSSYYGSQCQYQNQRLSLSIQFRALSDSWQILFAIVISLIDDTDQRTIHSYEQFTYLSRRDCRHHFNIYLVYSTRPKHLTKKYAIHVDIYEKQSLDYRGSLLYQINFPFLPVHRLAFIVYIPTNDYNTTHTCSNDRCIHGKCFKYYNNTEHFTFCQCDEGWSGKYCTIQHNCTCSSNSLCIGISSNNQSICVCPLHKFGSRCLLTDIICQTNNTNSTCQNGGQCISDDDYLGADQSFTCICPKGFSGKRCEIPDNKIILSFNQRIILSPSLFIHFIEFYIGDHKRSVKRLTTFQTIPITQDSITIYWSQSFHLVFVEMLNNAHYLTVFQNDSTVSTTIINKMINPSNHCPHISELFNKTFVKLDLIRRIKYYHQPCQNQTLNLSCFHDDTHYCLCYDYEQQRLANCFQFDHNMRFDCSGQSECENNGTCLQDDPECPKKFLCVCQDCYYGSRCQFSTSGFGLSLDAILGYHVIPQPGINQQKLIIKIGLSITIIFMMIGFVNGILCILTFKNKVVREIGCGLYLLGTSITTLITMFVFGLKFLIFLLAQMTIIKDETFLQIQCHSLDFILRVCLNLDQWLNACVAIERAFTVIKGVQFNKKQSKRIAKYIISILLFIIICTFIHEPIHRHIIDEDNEYDEIKRKWCVITYAHGVEIYDYFIHSLHFFGPFLINVISSIIFVTKLSRQQLVLHPQQTYKEILRKQIREHKHLLTAPILLVILALPRLILTFVSKCMKSTNDAWFFLIGYFISFIPSMLTFLIFIFPSKFYKTELRKSIRQFRSTIQRRLNLTSRR